MSRLVRENYSANKLDVDWKDQDADSCRVVSPVMDVMGVSMALSSYTELTSKSSTVLLHAIYL